MSKLSDAIDNLEVELEEATEEVYRLRRRLSELDDDLAERTEELDQAISNMDSLIAYINSVDSGLIDAWGVAEKLDG